MPRKSKREPNYAAPKPTMAELLLHEQEFNHVSVDFLKIDMATALTFAGIAQQTDDVVKKRRNQRAARKAYDTVRKLAQKVELNHDDADVLSSGLARLKSELLALGETF